MKKRALRKDFFYGDQAQHGQISVHFFIVAIGCAFSRGSRHQSRIYALFGDAYFDRKNMMDIEVISTLGLTEDDLDAIRNVDSVSAAEAGILRICSLPRVTIGRRARDVPAPVHESGAAGGGSFRRRTMSVCWMWIT